MIRRKLNRIGLTQVGDISWQEHVGIFTIPVRVVVKYNVSLLVWSENSQNEYGEPVAVSENNVLSSKWLEEFGGLVGLRVTDLIGMEGIEQKYLILYTYPSDDELEKLGVRGIFLGYAPKQFFKIVNRFWNREIFEKVGEVWMLKESVHNDLVNMEGENV